MRAQAQKIISEARYSRKAKDGEAPFFCNCVTAIRYLFAKASGVLLPHQWIGNLPRMLIEKGWQIAEVQLADLQAGDLVFMRRLDKIREITHVALALSANCFFQCTEGAGGCEITACEPLHERYEPVLKRETLLTYEDPRSQTLPQGAEKEEMGYNLPSEK